MVVPYALFVFFMAANAEHPPTWARFPIVQSQSCYEAVDYFYPPCSYHIPHFRVHYHYRHW